MYLNIFYLYILYNIYLNPKVYNKSLRNKLLSN